MLDDSQDEWIEYGTIEDIAPSNMVVDFEFVKFVSNDELKGYDLVLMKGDKTLQFHFDNTIDFRIEEDHGIKFSCQETFWDYFLHKIIANGDKDLFQRIIRPLKTKEPEPKIRRDIRVEYSEVTGNPMYFEIDGLRYFFECQNGFLRIPFEAIKDKVHLTDLCLDPISDSELVCNLDSIKQYFLKHLETSD